MEIVEIKRVWKKPYLWSAASMVEEDVRLMSILALIVILIVFIGFKEWKLFLFHRDFARSQAFH